MEAPKLKLNNIEKVLYPPGLACIAIACWLHLSDIQFKDSDSHKINLVAAGLSLVTIGKIVRYSDSQIKLNLENSKKLDLSNSGLASKLPLLGDKVSSDQFQNYTKGITELVSSLKLSQSVHIVCVDSRFRLREGLLSRLNLPVSSLLRSFKLYRDAKSRYLLFKEELKGGDMVLKRIDGIFDDQEITDFLIQDPFPVISFASENYDPDDDELSNYVLADEIPLEKALGIDVIK